MARMGFAAYGTTPIMSIRDHRNNVDILMKTYSGIDAYFVKLLSRLSRNFDLNSIENMWINLVK